MNRRQFIQTTSLAALGSPLSHAAAKGEEPGEAEVIIDIHQHLSYLQREDDAFLKHQRRMGIARTVLLPAGKPYLLPATWHGKANGLAAKVSGNAAAMKFVEQHPESFVAFCNAVPGTDDTRPELEKWLKLGAVGIGEQKFALDVHGKEMRLVFDIAREFQVPVLMHFENKRYNFGLDRLHEVLEKYPTVNFIGHAQAWWGNIDKHHDQAVNYPKGKVTPGGITDRLLSDYPNIYGDLSAGSGRNALARDPEHAVEFLHRHQDKLCLGTDCPDTLGTAPKCSGEGQISQVRKWVPDANIRHKIFAGNAKKIIRF